VPVENGTAVYNTYEDVNLYSSFEDGYAQTYDITAPGEVTIHKSNYSDQVEITKNGNDYEIVVTNSEGKKITYKVKGPPSKIKLDFLPENITFNGRPYGPGMDRIIDVEGQAEYPQALMDLMQVSGKDAEAILRSLNNAGYTQFQTVEDLIEALNSSSFPPSPPNGQLIRFLLDVSNNSVKTGNSSQGSGDQVMGAYLKALYGDGQTISAKWDAAKVNVEITFGTQKITLNSQTGEPAATWPTSTDILNNLPTGEMSDGRTRTFVSKVDLAMQTGNWESVIGYLNDCPEYIANDIVRKFVTSLYKIAGNDMDKLKSLLGIIPANVRKAMVDTSKNNGDERDREMSQRDEGDQWDTTDTLAILESVGS